MHFSTDMKVIRSVRPTLLTSGGGRRVIPPPGISGGGVSGGGGMVSSGVEVRENAPENRANSIENSSFWYNTILCKISEKKNGL